MEVGVVAPAGCREVAHDLLVLHAPQGYDRQGHRVDDGRRVADLAFVARRSPPQAAFGRVVGIVVEERRDGVVEAVHVVERNSYGRSSVGTAIKNEK